MTNPPPVDSAPFDALPRRTKPQGAETWMPRFRWFIAELLVVITGILIALALQSWWGDRADARREHSYLEQLVADTRQNEEILKKAIQKDSAARERSLRMLHILRDGGPLEGPDTLAALSRMTPATTVLISATYDAMIATGEIRLLQETELRSSILAMGAELQRTQLRLASNTELQISYTQQRTKQLLRHVQPYSPPSGAKTPDPLDIAWWTRVDFSKMRNDADAMAPFQMSVYTLNNSLANMRRFLSYLVDFRKKVETYSSKRAA